MGNTSNFSLWQTYLTWPHAVMLWDFGSWVSCSFFYYLVLFPVSLVQKRPQSGHLHLQLVANVHLLSLEMQDANRLFPSGLAQSCCNPEVARNLITGTLWKKPKISRRDCSTSLLFPYQFTAKIVILGYFLQCRDSGCMQINQLYYLLQSEHQKLFDGF